MTLVWLISGGFVPTRVRIKTSFLTVSGNKKTAALE